MGISKNEPPKKCKVCGNNFTRDDVRPLWGKNGIERYIPYKYITFCSQSCLLESMRMIIDKTWRTQ